MASTDPISSYSVLNQAVQVSHPVRCQECSANPIKGRRHRSIVHSYYNICHFCWLTKHQNEEGINDSFVEFDHWQSEKESRLFPYSDRKARLTVNLTHLTPHIHGVDMRDTVNPIEDMEVKLLKFCPAEALDRFASWVSNHTAILAIRVHVLRGETQQIQRICDALKGSQSLECVKIILWIDGMHQVSQEAASSLQTLLKTGGVIQHLTIQLTQRTIGFFASNTPQNPATDILAFFHAYRTNWYLPLLELDKVAVWMDRWDTTGVAGNQSQHHGSILQEVLDFPMLTAFFKADKVPLLYHLLSRRPDVLVGQTDKILSSTGADPPKSEFLGLRMRKKGKDGALRWYQCGCCEAHVYGGKDALKEHWRRASKTHPKHIEKMAKRRQLPAVSSSGGRRLRGIRANGDSNAIMMGKSETLQ